MPNNPQLATTLLHGLIQTADITPAKVVRGHVIISSVIPTSWVPLLEMFDADGDPDLERVCEDEGLFDEREPDDH